MKNKMSIVIVFLLISILSISLVSAIWPFTGDASLSPKNKEKCQYKTQCSNVKGQVIALGNDEGFISQDGMLVHEHASSNRFTFIKLTQAQTGGTYSFDTLEDFRLRLCETKIINWPIDNSNTLTMPVKIRKVGMNGNIALIELSPSPH